jgi:hypothetical protein
MRGVWKRLLPQCANRSDFEEETLIEEKTNIGRDLEYNGPENDYIQELLNSHSEELTVYDVLLLDQQRESEEAHNDAEERVNAQVQEFTLKEYEVIFRAVEVMEQKFMDSDPNSIEACKFAELRIKHSAPTRICMKTKRK